MGASSFPGVEGKGDGDEAKIPDSLSALALGHDASSYFWLEVGEANQS